MLSDKTLEYAGRVASGLLGVDTLYRRESADGDGLVARGLLTIKGESHEVDLPITLLGKQDIPEQMQQMLGGTTQVASFKASTAVDRSDYGVGVGSWAATMVVGGDVSIEILLEAHRK